MTFALLSRLVDYGGGGGGVQLQGCCSQSSLNSNGSLPGAGNHRRLPERRVASWAACFERLLQDPVGVRYFSVRWGTVSEINQTPSRVTRCVAENSWHGLGDHPNSCSIVSYFRRKSEIEWVSMGNSLGLSRRHVPHKRCFFECGPHCLQRSER